MNLTIILTFLKKAYEHRGKILTGLFVILAILFVRQCNDKRYIEEKANQNEAFYKEEIKTYKTKDGRYRSERAVLMATMSELKKDTSRLAQEVMKLKKEKSKPKVVIVTEIVYRDTGSVGNTISQLDTNKYSVDFDYTSSDEIFKIKGRNHFFATPYQKNGKLGLKLKSDKSFLDSMSVKIGLTLGIKKDKDGIDRVFATANSDKISFTSLDAVLIEDHLKNKNSDKNKKRFGIGPYVGVGITIGPNKINYGPTIGIGLQYNFIRF